MHGIKVNPIRTYVNDPALAPQYKRESIARVDKSWSGNGVDADRIIAEARFLDPVVARLLELARTFGLRANETLRLRPGLDDKHDHLHIHRGTKTGRQREMKYATFDADLMRQVIESVKAELGPGGLHAAWADRTLVQSRRRLYYILERLDITKKGLGVTIHGLRAQWAIEQFEKLTGATTPVRGGHAMDYRQFSDARLEISRALGHNRINVTSAYYGSFFAMKLPAELRFRDSWRELQAHLPFIQDALHAHHISNLWWVGARANGANVGKQDGWEFLIDEETSFEQAVIAKESLEKTLDACGVGVVCVHVADRAPHSAKQRWANHALPLFDVAAPVLKIEPATSA
nr:integrase domain-containing protein [Roseateles albus]